MGKKSKNYGGARIGAGRPVSKDGRKVKLTIWVRETQAKELREKTVNYSNFIVSLLEKAGIS